MDFQQRFSDEMAKINGHLQADKVGLLLQVEFLSNQLKDTQQQLAEMNPPVPTPQPEIGQDTQAGTNTTEFVAPRGAGEAMPIEKGQP